MITEYRNTYVSQIIDDGERMNLLSNVLVQLRSFERIESFFSRNVSLFFCFFFFNSIFLTLKLTLKFIGTRKKWSVKRTGIQQRQILMKFGNLYSFPHFVSCNDTRFRNFVKYESGNKYENFQIYIPIYSMSQ